MAVPLEQGVSPACQEMWPPSPLEGWSRDCEHEQACCSQGASEAQTPKAGRALETLAPRPFPNESVKAELLPPSWTRHPLPPTLSPTLDAPQARPWTLASKLLLRVPGPDRPVTDSLGDSPLSSDSPPALHPTLGFGILPAVSSWAATVSQQASALWVGRAEGKHQTRPRAGRSSSPPSLPSYPPALFPSSTSLTRPGSRKQAFGEGILLGEERQTRSLVLQTQGNLSWPSPGLLGCVIT